VPCGGTLRATSGDSWLGVACPLGLLWALVGLGQAVTIYAFTLIAADGSSQSAGVREAASDDDACELASELLLESEFPIIEVWRGRWRIYRVSKIDNEQSDRKPPAASARSRARGLTDGDPSEEEKPPKRGRNRL
jgi:hypothetical protein